MAKHRIRRWLQFGMLDLLLLMAIVGIGAVLSRPAQITADYDPLAEGSKAGQHWAGNGLRMRFRWCPPDEFKMGSPADEPDRLEKEEQVSVTLSRGFWLGKYEVTQGEYRQVMNHNPSFFPKHERDAALGEVDADKLPVEGVLWEEAVEFCRVFTEQERKAGRLPVGWEYRLPSEAQWEYACRAGTQTLYSFGDDESRLADFAWYGDNFVGGTHEVGEKLPNAWGLHDMHGNVLEWCIGIKTGPLGGPDPEAKGRAVHCGGSWDLAGEVSRSAFRFSYAPGFRDGSIGFRLAAVQSR